MALTFPGQEKPKQQESVQVNVEKIKQESFDIGYKQGVNLAVNLLKLTYPELQAYCKENGIVAQMKARSVGVTVKNILEASL